MDQVDRDCLDMWRECIEYRMARTVLITKVSGGRVRGRPRLGWMDGVKMVLGSKRMTVEAARQKDSKEWRAGCICKLSFTWPLLVECRYMMRLG